MHIIVIKIIVSFQNTSKYHSLLGSCLNNQEQLLDFILMRNSDICIYWQCKKLIFFMCEKRNI